MTKCELIARERLINELIESSKHHAQTSREESLLYRDRQIVREQPTITEQEIIKPILDKIIAEIEQMNNIDYVEPVTVDEVLQIINKYKTESEG